MAFFARAEKIMVGPNNSSYARCWWTTIYGARLSSCSIHLHAVLMKKVFLCIF